ncbi:PHD-type domain-containing protein [Caenorhabditis elegans]|uniref:PHD-type domain-containing protein n=1 Tax=Caenorhabditis elegans TaxID=6239 RepID=Q9GRZ5_CAEEL|nr:PHD-type domain-containing protein [Caenorhabditis elegans]CAC14404.2 PHD-type domain-containing protein [Caenorhabditis elegans]|eukprot:NP_507508.2 PHd Finger family [Caenorhabditis elegans]
MSNTPESSIFGKMTSRAAGKRQIKPTAILFATLTENHTSDEEDDDFEVNPAENDAKTGSEADSGSDSQENSDEEESEDEENDEEEAESAESSEKPERTPSAEKDAVICGVCINQRNIVAAGDFLQCQKCGINVHESCYGTLPGGSDDASWYCEPCLYGLTLPPHCEFCPSRFGAFKRADIRGRWAHAICALYTHGVNYAQTHTRCGVSWEHLDNNAHFGRRTCTACTDKIEARFGIASRCESGMCKEYLHVTCAQKLGLLVDETDDNDTEIAVMRYFFCKKHTNRDNLKPYQRKFDDWEKSEARRITVNRRLRSGELEKNEQKEHKELRVKMREEIDKVIEEECKNKPKGDISAGEKPKQARLLNSSAEFFDRFETKAEEAGLSRKEFRDPFFNIKLNSGSHVPIGFSKEYIDFMQIRDSQIIPEEEEKLRKSRELLAETKANQEKKSSQKHLVERFSANEELIEQKLTSIEKLHQLLTELGGDSGLLLSDFNNRQSCSRSSPAIIAPKKMNYTCVVCRKSTEQHKQTQCDECHKSYHIGCLSPPLTRLPKRNNFGWICHECNESSDSEQEIIPEASESTTRSVRSRRPPARLSAFINH